jgi:hypothetical protein
VARLLSSGDLCSAVKAGRPQIVRLLAPARAVIDRKVIDEVAHTGTGEMFDEVVGLLIDPVASSSSAGSHSLVRIRNALWHLTRWDLTRFFWAAGASCLLVRRMLCVVCSDACVQPTQGMFRWCDIWRNCTRPTAS